MTGDDFEHALHRPRLRERNDSVSGFGSPLTLGFVPFFRCRTAFEIHDFRAHFGRKKPS
jgi:hypothetical protein